MFLRLPAHTAIKSESPSNLGEGQGLKRSFDQIVRFCVCNGYLIPYKYNFTCSDCTLKPKIPILGFRYS